MPLQLFVERKPCYRLTWPARLVILSATVALIATAGSNLGDFLAIDAPVEGRFLVVEGWMPVYAFREAVDRFRKGAYEKIIVVARDDADENASGCAIDKDLVRFGVSGDRVAIALAPQTERDRTFHSALAVKSWLSREDAQYDAVDILTLGPHARRSRLLFEKALGVTTKVGVIAIADRRFDQRHWWRSSAGFRIVSGEAVAYLYVTLFPWTRD